MENDYFCGSFVWAGVDYIGESMGWPSKGWAATLFDMCMDEKPRAALFTCDVDRQACLENGCRGL